MDDIIVKKSDWQTIDMPEQTKSFIVEIEFSPEEMKLIKKGYKPQHMEQKWFMYYEDDKLFCHRSWSGYCIYIMDFSEKGKIKIIANRNPEQELRDARVFGDKNMIRMLLGTLLRKDIEMYLVGGNGGVVNELPKDIEGEEGKNSFLWRWKNKEDKTFFC